MNNIDILEEYIKELNKNKKIAPSAYDTGFGKYWSDFGVAIEALIAENKELKEENEGLKTKLDTLIEKYKELKEEKETDYTSVYLKGVYDERDKWQKKIKEMIEELKETADEDNMEDFVRIEILQYLLRKE